jgi:hypothetical protein
MKIKSHFETLFFHFEYYFFSGSGESEKKQAKKTKQPARAEGNLSSCESLHNTAGHKSAKTHENP